MNNKTTKVKTELINDRPRPRNVSSSDFVALRNKVTDLIQWW